uniref:RING-H2 finger protein ATL67-like n=1 Tax=Erigeron canadensis TaxID=72917 RepID=UPI001CB9917F|nr:RING-H2 finger protein ATL67-like [Erigeron canadensis]
MSTTPPPPHFSTTTQSYITNLGLGYAIAIAFGFLVLLSSLILTSYICFRHNQRRNNNRILTTRNRLNNSENTGIILPSIIFIDNNNNDHNDDHNVVIGLDQCVINTYPKFPYSKSGKKNDNLCAICLCEYKEGEMMRMLPDCKHFFHLTCVDAWLKLNATCPVCRSSPLPTPLSTPLAEVVPLSQYADGRRPR